MKGVSPDTRDLHAPPTGRGLVGRAWALSALLVGLALVSCLLEPWRLLAQEELPRSRPGEAREEMPAHSSAMPEEMPELEALKPWEQDKRPTWEPDEPIVDIR